MIEPSSLAPLFSHLGLDDLISKGEVTEVQVKALLDGTATYHRLQQELSQQYGAPTRGTLIQTRYRDKPGGEGDLRLRIWYHMPSLDPGTWQPDGAEVILKEDKKGEGVNANSRMEIKAHPDLKLLAILRLAFDRFLGLHHDPHWAKIKEDYHISLKENTYRVSLQYLIGKNTPFGYVLEGNIKFPGAITTEQRDHHRAVLLGLFSSFGVHEDKAAFQTRVDQFIEENSYIAGSQ